MLLLIKICSLLNMFPEKPPSQKIHSYGVTILNESHLTKAVCLLVDFVTLTPYVIIYLLSYLLGYELHPNTLKKNTKY